jgi:hypothetical protein
MNAVARQPIHSLAVEASEASLWPQLLAARAARHSGVASSTQSRKRIIPINRHSGAPSVALAQKKSPGRAGAVQVKP